MLILHQHRPSVYKMNMQDKSNGLYKKDKTTMSDDLKLKEFLSYANFF